MNIRQSLATVIIIACMLLGGLYIYELNVRDEGMTSFMYDAVKTKAQNERHVSYLDTSDGSLTTMSTTPKNRQEIALTILMPNNNGIILTDTKGGGEVSEVYLCNQSGCGEFDVRPEHQKMFENGVMILYYCALSEQMPTVCKRTQ